MADKWIDRKREILQADLLHQAQAQAQALAQQQQAAANATAAAAADGAGQANNAYAGLGFSRLFPKGKKIFTKAQNGQLDLLAEAKASHQMEILFGRDKLPVFALYEANCFSDGISKAEWEQAKVNGQVVYTSRTGLEYYEVSDRPSKKSCP